LVELLTKAIHDNETVQLIQASSEIDKLDDLLGIEDYLILINEDSLKSDIRDLVGYLFNRTQYNITPIIVATGKEFDLSDDVQKLVPVISVLRKDVPPAILGHYLVNLLNSFESNRNLNALSGLPGNNVIDRKLSDSIESGKDFALMYIDLDNFKEYNEYYGFHKGDQVILFFTRILYEVMSECGAETDFVGHVGGDDFVVILQNTHIIKEVGDRIIAHFDAGISDFYEAKDLKNGYIEVRNRAGVMERIRIMSVSIIVVDGNEFRTTTLDNMYKKMMLYKKQAKMVKGSVLLQAPNASVTPPSD
jgi:diguanylate cyclase (GGDEF)-like protein